MKRKFLLSSAVVPALMASSAMAQVVNFHDASNGQLSFPGVGYDELFAGQGAYLDPGNDIWNGFGQYPGYQSTYFYSGSPGGSPPWPQQSGNPGNPYAAYNSGSGWVTSTGSSLFDFATGSHTASGNATSSGQLTAITLSVGNYAGDSGLANIGSLVVPNGTPGFLLGETAVRNGGASNEVFTLQHVPAGTYGLYLYAANYDNNRGTLFSVNSGTAHNGIAATLNGMNGAPAPTFVEGQNYVIFQNVTPDGSGNITITAIPNPQDGVGNANLAGETDVNGFQLIFNPPPTAVGSTPAQNVEAGTTANFLFSPAFATSPTFRWQFISGGVTNNLTDGGKISGSATTNLTIASVASTNTGFYQCLIVTATATNTSPAAPLTILTSPATSPLQQGDAASVVGSVLLPKDTLTDFGNNIPGGPPYNSIPPFFVLGLTNVEDGSLEQYINFGANGNTAPFVGPVGIVVTPQLGTTVVTGMRFFTASGHSEDDPADYLLEGSDDGINYTNIAGGFLGLPVQRNAAGGAINITNQVLKEIDFANTIAYSTYRLTFTNVVNDAAASNGLQIAELQLLGSLPAVKPGIAQEPAATNILLVGTTLRASVVASGAGPFSYKWYYNTSTQIANATNATLIITNVQTTNSGIYDCVISNPYGSTNSSTLSLTVVTPTPYQQSLLAYNPLGYWPLNETNGVVAFDYANGYNGTYIGAVVTLGQPGVPDAGFGATNYSASFGGLSYVDIPEGPFNITNPITIMAWVQTTHPGFSGILGHGDSSYRITDGGGGDPGFASGNDSGDATGATPITDGNWHLIAGVYMGGTGTNGANGFLYVDGVVVASNSITSVPGNTLDLWIAGAPDYGTGNSPSRFYLGNVCNAAVIPAALSAAQVQQLYGAGEIPPTVTVPSNPILVDQGANTSISSIVTGTTPFAYQWYFVNAGVTNSILGATNGTLPLTDVQPVQATYQYFVVVTNAYGVGTSAFATLNVQAGPPVIQADISPLLVEVPVGVPVTFSVSVSGTAPFFYQWFHGSSPVAGATNTSYTLTSLAGTNSYSVTISNAIGTNISSTAVVVGLTTPPPVVTFNTNGLNWTVNQPSGWPGTLTNPNITSNLLTLTDGTNSEAATAFYNIPQYIGGFVASYVYQAAGGGTRADGITFCIQNSPMGTNAIGGGGGSFAYAGISNSAAFEMNIYTGDHGGVGIIVGTNGNVPDTDLALGNFLSTSPVNINSGNPITVQLYYNQNILNVYLADALGGAFYNTSFAVTNMPATVGGSTALVGFTGATGGLAAYQTVSNFVFSYTTPPILSAARGAAGSVVVSWPVSVASEFGLVQSTNINGPTWLPVNATPTIVNAQNQVTLSPTNHAGFFKLSLQ